MNSGSDMVKGVTYLQEKSKPIASHFHFSLGV